MHAAFEALRAALPMNCRAVDRRVAIDAAVERDIARILAIWGEARERYGHGGAWLYGAFSIADAFYAPVVLRFKSYGVAVTDVAQRYMEHVLADADVQAWRDAAARETEVLEEEEVGR